MHFSHYYILLLSIFFYLKCGLLGYNTECIGAAHGKVIVCYLGAWAVYRPDRGSFSLENVNPSLCTHLVYAFSGLNSSNSQIYSLDPWQDLTDNYGKGGYKRVVAMKQKYPHLKVTLAIGGWNEGSEKYSQLAKDPTKRSNFVSSAVEFIRKYKFDGLDLDWEYPGLRGGSAEDKVNFLYLVKELKSAFSKFNLLLTAALGASKATIDTSYDIAALSYYLDYIHLMCYDYHGPWDNKTGPNAPLTSNDFLSVEYSVKYLMKLGAPSNKIIMGIPLYGKTFILIDHVQNSKILGAPTKTVGFQSPFTKENGLMGYNEICLDLQNKSSNWEVHWDFASETPFAINNEKFISYDNDRSITAKVKFAMMQKLGGLMVWSIDTDDFQGDCGEGRYPLMKTINRVVGETLELIKKDDENKVISDNGSSAKDYCPRICSNNFLLLVLLNVIYYCCL